MPGNGWEGEETKRNGSAGSKIERGTSGAGEMGRKREEAEEGIEERGLK